MLQSTRLQIVTSLLLFQRLAMSVATESETHIAPGLYRNKQRKMPNNYCIYFDGQSTSLRELSLAGVGRKTANVVMSAGWDSALQWTLMLSLPKAS